MPQGQGRIAAIDMLKGLAILLMVGAHLVKHQTLPVPDWYALFKVKVYLFHMPLFMFASGYLFFQSGVHRRPWPLLRTYAVRRAHRLLVPFLAISVATLAGKMLLADVAHVDDAPSSAAQALTRLFIGTESSPVLTVWHLFVLYVFCVFTPPLYRLAGCRRWPLLLLAICLYPLAPPDVLFANRLTTFYLFFVAGGLAQSWRWVELPPSHVTTAVLCTGFALVLALPIHPGAALAACGLVAAVALPGALQVLPGAMRNALQFFGRHSMPIYLFNVIAIGVAKAVFLQLLGYRPSLFVPLLLVTFAAGTGAPLLLKWLSGLSPRTCFFHRYIQ